MSKETVNVGVVGVGGWGKNLARNYSQIPEADLRYLCDLDKAKLKAMQGQFEAERTTTRFDDLIEDPELQAIVIATTVPGKLLSDIESSFSRHYESICANGIEPELSR